MGSKINLYLASTVSEQHILLTELPGSGQDLTTAAEVTSVHIRASNIQELDCSAYPGASYPPSCGLTRPDGGLE